MSTTFVADSKWQSIGQGTIVTIETANSASVVYWYPGESVAWVTPVALFLECYRPVPEPVQRHRMSDKDLTCAIGRYARRHGYYARTVRDVTTLRQCAVNEWIQPGTRWKVGRTEDGRPSLPERAS